MSIAGASRFIGSATLANTQGLGAQRPQVLGSSLGPGGLLQVAQAAGRVEGIGLSSRARALNSQFLSQTAGQGVALFGLASGASQSVADFATQIRALRSSLPSSQVADFVVEAERAEAAEAEAASEEQLREAAESAVSSQRGLTRNERESEIERLIELFRAELESSQPDRSRTFRRGELVNQDA